MNDAGLSKFRAADTYNCTLSTAPFNFNCYCLVVVVIQDALFFFGGQINNVETFCAGIRPHVRIAVDEDGAKQYYVLTVVVCFFDQFMNTLVNGLINYFGCFIKWYGGAEYSVFLAEQYLLNGVHLEVHFGHVAFHNLIVYQFVERTFGGSAASRIFCLTDALNLTDNSVFGDADVGAVLDKDRTFVGYVAGKGPHARKARKRKTIQAAHFERPQKLVRSGWILNGVYIVAANTVGQHDLARL